MANELAIKQLRRKRGGLKHKLTNFETFLNPVQDAVAKNTSVTSQIKKELEQRLSKSQTILDEFELLQTDIECTCTDAELDEEYAQRNAFTDNFNSILAKASSLVDTLNATIYNKLQMSQVASDSVIQPEEVDTPEQSQPAAPEQSQSGPVSDVALDSQPVQSLHNIQPTTQNIQLPTISLPKFKGNYDSWLEFKDTFESLIHCNQSISDIQRFHYLRASLEAEPLKVIQSIEFCGNNYANSWRLLCERYDNSKMLVHNHLKCLFELDPISKETALSLRNLIDTVNKHTRALEQLGQPVAFWDTVLLFMLSSKLDKVSSKEWERHKIKQDSLKLSDFLEFIRSRADWLETLEVNYKVSKESKHNTNSSRSLAMLSHKTYKCNFCSGGHLIYYCKGFLNLDVPTRAIKVKELNLCPNCLHKSHGKSSCRLGPCHKCKAPHNKLLHQDTPLPSAPPASQVTLASVIKNNYVMLATAQVLVQNANGEFITARLVFDCGSQSNYISESLFKKLKLNKQPALVNIIGINSIASTLDSKCTVTIKSKYSNFTTTFSCFILPQITENLPSFEIDTSKWPIPANINLADEDFDQPGPVDILLGAGYFWNFIKDGSLSLNKGLLILRNTVLGWIVAGPIAQPAPNKTICNFSKLSDLNNEVRRFWEIEETTDSLLQLSREDAMCEEHFINTLSVTPEGQFVVRLPFKFSPSLLGNSKNMALKRFLQLEKRIHHNPELYSLYKDFIGEYERLNHMTKKSVHEDDSTDYFLPHHGVTKHDSLTTKLRVVFDGSAASESGWSLNEILYTGPSIHNELFSILIRFRQHRFVVCSDVEKMYRAILVHPDDRKYQNILWRDNPDDEILTYRLNTVTYGTSSAPYQALRCIKQIALDNATHYPISSKIIDKDIYVDDLITGFPSEEIAISVCKEISDILAKYHFNLRKWISNCPTLAKVVAKENDPIQSLQIGENFQTKLLGVQWLPCSDQLTYHITHVANSLPDRDSKRSILSSIATIFDPLGLVSPCVILAKILIQKLWELKLDWDEPIPSTMSEAWQKFKTQLHLLNEVRFPRHAVCPEPDSIELHGFCDASIQGYAACIFVRSMDQFDNIQVRLLCAKTKVAPLKSLTIPRLELCSALLLSKLMKKVTDSLALSIGNIYYWSDSQITLCWIQTAPKQLQTFVCNRVNQIQHLTSTKQWHYINTKDNPADIASRGAYPKALLKSNLWSNGPPWLSLPHYSWPNMGHEISQVNLPELRMPSLSLVSSLSNELSLFDRFSELSKLKRVLAYCLRFINNCKSVNENRYYGPLTVEELKNSMTVLVKHSQRDNFASEIEHLNSGSELSKKSRLLSLSPFLDDNRIVRVGGRLKNSELSYDSKHPILLNGKHRLSKLIFQHYHKLLCHAAPQLLLATVRQEYWPTSGISVAKGVVRNCITCFRFKPKSEVPIMAHLPKDRVTNLNPFTTTGVDYAGPIVVKDRKGRGPKFLKSYICLFICFSSKAMHLELVSDLTSECFIGALRRFSSRRGRPSHIYSDNGTNFVCANKELQVLYNFLNKSKNIIVETCANEGITWHFIPAYSPHFGGLWESGVKRVKHHLFRVTKNVKLTFEELNTLLIQIEAILNSRPLHPLSNDPNDLEPLTPSHFLIGKSLLMVPDPSLEHIPVNKLSRYQLLQKLNQDFWKRWSREYLSQIQQKNKWKSHSENIRVGALVMIKQENSPPCYWPLGRVVQIHPDSEGSVRVATVKIAKSTITRAVAKLCVLPLCEEKEINT